MPGASLLYWPRKELVLTGNERNSPVNLEQQ